MNSIFEVKYIKEEYKDNLRNYKYRGGDNSILYKIFINPFCNWAVEYLPMWLAPNVITVSGFFLNVTYFLITTYYTRFKGAEYIPPWACYFCAFAYSTYIILDNMDGKQARRTKASSPLGLLVDHGTDACTTFFITIGLGSFLFFNDIKHYTLLWLMINFPFFLNTWEEYYIGELFLPIVHGVSEGTVIIATVMCLSGKYGIDFWQRQVTVFGFTICLNTFSALLGCIGGQIFGYVSLVNVCIKCKDKWLQALSDCIIYAVLVGSYLIMIFWADSVIIRDYPQLLILMFGLAFAKLMGHLQLSHLEGSIFKPYRKSFMTSFIFCVIHTLLYKFLHITLIASIDYFILLFLTIHFIVWLHWVYFASDELCEVLNIKRFSLGPLHESTKKAQ